MHGLVLRTTDRAVLEEVLRAQEDQRRCSASGSTRDTVVVHPSERGHLKQALLKLGWPAEDFAGYVDGEAHAIDAARGRLDAAALPAARRPTASGTAAPASSCCPAAPARRSSARPRWPQAKATTLILVTNTVSARQWKARAAQAHLADRGRDRRVLRRAKEIRPVTIATYQVMTTRRKGVYTHLELFDARDWGLIVYDEVHLLPAPIFRMTADLQARRRLGLTATLVREDGREGDVFSLIGPEALRRAVEGHRGAGLHRAGRLRRGAGHADRRRAARLRDRRARGALPARRRRTPPRPGWSSELVAQHRGEPTLVIGQYLDQLDELGERLDAPVIKGETTVKERRAAVRRVPHRRDRPAGRLQGRELLHRPARGRGRDPGVAARSAPARRRRSGSAGCCAPRPTGGPRGSTRVVARDTVDAGLRRAPAAVPGRAGLRLPDRRRRRRPERLSPAQSSAR